MSNDKDGYASDFLHSVDGGEAWTASSGVRIIHKEADEDDDGLLDLHINATHEGIILDVYSQDTGELVKTAALTVEDLIALCH